MPKKWALGTFDACYAFPGRQVASVRGHMFLSLIIWQFFTYFGEKQSTNTRDPMVSRSIEVLDVLTQACQAPKVRAKKTPLPRQNAVHASACRARAENNGKLMRFSKPSIIAQDRVLALLS